MKMLRRNILLDTGKLISAYNTFLELPDECKRVNVQAKVVSVGDKCRQFSSKDIGRNVVMGVTRDLTSRMNPALSERLGLKPHWHFIVHEDKLICEISK